MQLLAQDQFDWRVLEWVIYGARCEVMAGYRLTRALPDAYNLDLLGR